jgi:hypothetical protein
MVRVTPRAEHHRAEAELADPHTGASKGPELHGRNLVDARLVDEEHRSPSELTVERRAGYSVSLTAERT